MMEIQNVNAFSSYMAVTERKNQEMSSPTLSFTPTQSKKMLNKTQLQNFSSLKNQTVKIQGLNLSKIEQISESDNSNVENIYGV